METATMATAEVATAEVVFSEFETELDMAEVIKEAQEHAADVRAIIDVQRGNKAAFGEVYARYIGRAISVAHKFVHNSEEAEDVAHDAFISALNSIDRFNVDAPFFPWLAKIVENRCLNVICRKQYYMTESMQELEDEEFAQFVDHHADDPIANLLRKERNERIRKAVNELPKKFKEVIVMNHFNDMSYKEMSESLGIPIGTVMSRLFNARKILKDMLKDEVER